MERIIDIHVHDVPLSRKLPALFHQVIGRLPAGDPSRERAERAKLPDLLGTMDRADVETSLVVLHEETDEILRLAAEHPGRLFGLTYFDSLLPREGLERVRALCESHPDLILGVETALPLFRQDPRIKDFVPLYEFCLERELPILFHMHKSEAGQAIDRPTAFGVVAAAYPRLKLVCLHAGGGWHRELPGLLRGFPNLFLAVAGLPGGELGEDGTPQTLRDLLRQAGSRTLMFGTGWPETSATYEEAVRTLRGLPWWQRRNVCWHTAFRVFGGRILKDRTPHTSPFSSTR